MLTRINGIPLHYKVAGPKRAPWLVLIHGFPFHLEFWKDQVPALSRRWRVLRYDLRGLGKSGLGPAPQLLEAYVDDLLALMDHVGAGRAVLAGLSMGGYIALRAAQKAPTRVAGLALCDTRAEADSDAAKLGRSAALATLRTQGLAAYVDGSLPKLLAPATLKRRPAVVRALRRLMMASPKAGVANGLVAMAGRTDSVAHLPELKIPVLCLVGAEDALTPPLVARGMHGAIPGARLAVIPGAGHVSNLEQPAAFNRALGAWLARIRPGL
jgi:3-oxoadipate enol-lactonase